MKKERIKEVLTSMSNFIEQDQINLYQKLIDEKGFDNIVDIESFYFGLIYPHQQFITGLIKSEISTNNDVVFIMTHSQFIERHFEFWIKKLEGTTCCADKSRTILRNLTDFYKTGIKIEFDYNAEYTFHLPKTIFKTHESIIEFYKGLIDLYYGNPLKYLIAVQPLMQFKEKN